MANILVVGGTGFLGINLALGLSARGHRLVITGTRPLPPEVLATLPELKVFPVRLSDEAAIEHLLSYTPDVIMHVASTLTPGSSSTQLMIERENVINPTVRLLNVLSARQIPVVFMSSGGTVYGSSNKYRFNEDDPCCPISSYGQAKLEIENHIHFAHRVFGLQYIILRPSNPYGLYQPLYGGQGLISVIFGKLRHGQPLEVWGDGNSIRDYIHVNDFVNATCTVLERKAWNQTFNIGSGTGYSLLDIVNAIEFATGRQVPMVFKPSRGVDVDRVILDVTRLTSLGTWHPRSLAAGIHSYAQQLRLINDE